MIGERWGCPCGACSACGAGTKAHADAMRTKRTARSHRVSVAVTEADADRQAALCALARATYPLDATDARRALYALAAAEWRAGGDGRPDALALGGLYVLTTAELDAERAPATVLPIVRIHLAAWRPASEAGNIDAAQSALRAIRYRPAPVAGESPREGPQPRAEMAIGHCDCGTPATILAWASACRLIARCVGCWPPPAPARVVARIVRPLVGVAPSPAVVAAQAVADALAGAALAAAAAREALERALDADTHTALRGLRAEVVVARRKLRAELAAARRGVRNGAALPDSPAAAVARAFDWADVASALLWCQMAANALDWRAIMDSGEWTAPAGVRGGWADAERRHWRERRVASLGQFAERMDESARRMAAETAEIAAAQALAVASAADAKR